MSNKLISKKLIVIVPIMFFIIAFIRIYINYNENVKNLKQHVLEQSKLVNSLYMIHRAYYQNLYINDVIKLDEDTFLGLPSYSALYIGKNFSDNNKLKIKMVSDIVRNPNNQADIYELKAINYFRENKNEIEYFNEYDDFFQYATPLKISNQCLECHGEKKNAPKFISDNYDKAYNYEIGDVRGILSIKVPADGYNVVFSKQFISSIIYDFILIILISIIAIYLLRYFSKLQINLESELKEKTFKLDNSISFLRSYKEAIDKDLVVMKSDVEGNMIYANSNFCEITEYSYDEAVGDNHNILKNSLSKDSKNRLMMASDDVQETWYGSIRYVKKDGSYLWLNLSISPILNAKNQIDKYIYIGHDITQLIEQKDKLKTLATKDTLTKLNNRNVLSKEIENNENLSLILINIDSFSEINDFYGHEIGDKVLVEFSQRLQKSFEEEENINLFRLGGDEFCILLIDVKSHLVVKKAQEIMELVSSNTYEYGDETIELNVTIGVSFEDKSELLATVDMALTTARKEEKDLVIYDKTMSLGKEYENNMLWSKRIKQAIKDDRIVLYYQPIVDNKSKKTNRYEALIRLIDEDGNVISPHSFLEIAKKAKLYKQLTKIVIRKSFEEFRENDFEFSINLSIDDITDKEIYEYILEMLGVYNVSQRVIFEIVESESIENFQEVQKFIKSVKELGCRIAIDDFGTGYSNFEYLMRLEADFIKIDGSIIKEILNDKNSEIITSVIVDFAKKTNILVIAEYVESEEIYMKIKELGIDKSQGYYFGEPKPTL